MKIKNNIHYCTNFCHIHLTNCIEKEEKKFFPTGGYLPQEATPTGGKQVLFCKGIENVSVNI